MSLTSNRVLALLVVGALTGCRGKILATADLHSAGTAEAHFLSTGAPVALWADTDGKWTGGNSEHSHFPATYEIDVLSKGTKVGHVSCETQDANTSVCGTMVSVGSSHHGDCELKMTCQLPALPAGETVLVVTGTPGKAAEEVKNLSLKVREE